MRFWLGWGISLLSVIALIVLIVYVNWQCALGVWILSLTHLWDKH